MLSKCGALFLLFGAPDDSVFSSAVYKAAGGVLS
jgi:hypothetical protein